MKIKMYTKAMFFPFEGAPYEKTTCVVYDSIDDINMIDGKNTGKISLRLDTDGDVTPRKPVVYPYLMQDPISFTEKMLGNNMIAKAVSRKFTLSDLHHEWLQHDYDGVSRYEELVLKAVFGVHEKKWRSQREFFDFVAAHDNVEKVALIIAADSVIEAMRLAGEDEKAVEQYKKTYIRPAILKHLRK